MTIKAQVVNADIFSVEADAMITAINPNGDWYGYIDRQIKQRAGDWYHAQALAAKEMHGIHHGDVLVPASPDGNQSNLPVDHIIFVVDGMTGSLGDLIVNSLSVAQVAGFKTVTIPAIRCGKATGQYWGEPTELASILAIFRGMRKFRLVNPDVEMLVKFVVYRSDYLDGIFRQQVKELEEGDGD